MAADDALRSACHGAPGFGCRCVEEVIVTVYFRPDGQGGSDWHYGFFYVSETDHTAISNTAADTKAVKFYENGQLIILKNGIRYNALGIIMK